MQLSFKVNLQKMQMNSMNENYHLFMTIGIQKYDHTNQKEHLIK